MRAASSSSATQSVMGPFWATFESMAESAREALERVRVFQLSWI
jgi:mevalonate pyrophosphate decarboxylase